MGYLIITSVRSFSINMKNLFDFVLRRGVIKKLETDVIVLILSEVYGVYFLTAVVLLQNGLPKVYTYPYPYVVPTCARLQEKLGYSTTLRSSTAYF